MHVVRSSPDSYGLGANPGDAVGYALEQAIGVRLAPDLDATIAQIDALTRAPSVGVPPPTEAAGARGPMGDNE